MTLYFAYGSNLDLAQMRRRCPGAEVVGPAALADHRLAFVGQSQAWGGAVATVLPVRACVVMGLVYRMTPSDWESLDGFEGHPHVYQRQATGVRLAEAPLEAVTYVHRVPVPGEPSSRYFEQIRRAYAALGFDLAALERALSPPT